MNVHKYHFIIDTKQENEHEHDMVKMYSFIMAIPLKCYQNRQKEMDKSSTSAILIYIFFYLYSIRSNYINPTATQNKYT